MNGLMTFGISLIVLFVMALILFNKRLTMPKMNKWLIFGVTFIFLMSASTLNSLGLGQNKIAMGCLYGGFVLMYAVVNALTFFKDKYNIKLNVLGFVIATGGVALISSISYFLTTHPNLFIH